MTAPADHLDHASHADHARHGLLEISGLSIAARGRAIVREVSFSVGAGEFVGLVGESGSGKTQVARAIMGLTPLPLVRTAGSIVLAGQDLAPASRAHLRSLRGARIGMVFQEPMSSLNPSATIGAQLEEGLALHRPQWSKAMRRERVLEMLAQVGIPQAALAAWPHEFSGGMRQRMMLASVMLLEPALLIADEPTTALDAVVQRDVLELMVKLTRERNTAVLLISHDLPMVARYTERLIVMQQGAVIEAGNTAALLAAPTQDYTRKLLAAIPRRQPARPLPQVKVQAPALIEVRRLTVDYACHPRLFASTAARRVLHGIDLTVQPQEIVAVVGGSGSGKSTLGRAIAGLIAPSAGEILFKGQATRRGAPGWRDYRLNCQVVFQDPYSSLDPRMTIAELVGEGLRQLGGMSNADKRERVAQMLQEVGLDSQYGERHAHELSGGQRQRVAIARALVRHPSFVIADEPVSSLDVTVRAQVLELFAQLQQRHGFSCLFISHDLGVVEQIADRVLVMQDGRIIEQGSRDAIFDQPQQAYTRALLSAIPVLLPTPGGGMQLKWRFDEARPCHLRPSAQSADESILQSADDADGADSHGVGNRLN
ncbi:dipeptide ABC transporter ATP-binding protein [Verminephrobacter eiseniae]|uniref:dipeptide ABC transporter ATP-binding protein n=1 Tax=Verminephrobacter eiseniae TaxID=364317 RepID=UPI002238AD33|nr:ABC transporter ATP-binding protein [Verminephrobacter eiseniae]MCW5232565.1 ABC transporter ATP-binding protein [Verminephrobacter eiseniae]MCW5295870.1 ABC transporter ATP-binding protein [Verminephrobacter eiseniae]MCW8185129.1 ABC transporter ATP-binding protein [Verminephrobacter eiseniae]MCW8222798.1 ABC transporter ATP-binding protein [Verminephrobacter eiseniae]MCW8235075.1 ABC transporter ATP-binding protein [Verminephrobacter eiseniae]